MSSSSTHDHLVQRISATEAEIKEVKDEIKEVNDEIKAVKQKIESVEKKIDACAEMINAASQGIRQRLSNPDSPESAEWRDFYKGELKRLEAKERALREDKATLEAKDAGLLEEKKLLRQKEAVLRERLYQKEDERLSAAQQNFARMNLVFEFRRSRCQDEIRQARWRCSLVPRGE